MPRHKVWFLFLTWLPLASCSEADAPLPKTERPGQPTVYNIRAEDAEMSAAMLMARNSIGDFRHRLINPPPGQSYLSLKARIKAGDAVEHIWLEDVSIVGDSFRGTIGNEPVDVTTVKLGQLVTVPLDRVSDWMAIEDDRLVGGYTLRVIRNRMTPIEREEFDAKMGVTID